MQTEREKLLTALLDAVQRSQHFGSIPLPAVLENPLEELNEKYGYNKIDKKFIPKFDDDNEPEKDEFENITIKKPTKEELSKKLREKLKNLKKRRDNIKPKTLL